MPLLIIDAFLGGIVTRGGDEEDDVVRVLEDAAAERALPTAEPAAAQFAPQPPEQSASPAEPLAADSAEIRACYRAARSRACYRT